MLQPTPFLVAENIRQNKLRNKINKKKKREQFFKDRDDENVPIRPIYKATKSIDDKYGLIFKPQCNYKGCHNQPTIDAMLLKGDMYICKQHRIELVQDLKQTDNTDLQSIMSNLEQLDDARLYQKGKALEDDDYFLIEYSKLKQSQIQIAKKLLTVKDKMTPDYWQCMIDYKRLQEKSELLFQIRKISNPFLSGVLAAGAWIVAHKVVIGTIVCGSMSLLAAAGYVSKQTEKQTIQWIKETFFDNDNLGKSANMTTKDGNGFKQEPVNNYEENMSSMQREMDGKAFNDVINNTIKETMKTMDAFTSKTPDEALQECHKNAQMLEIIQKKQVELESKQNALSNEIRLAETMRKQVKDGDVFYFQQKETYKYLRHSPSNSKWVIYDENRRGSTFKLQKISGSGSETQFKIQAQNPNLQTMFGYTHLSFNRNKFLRLYYLSSDCATFEFCKLLSGDSDYKLKVYYGETFKGWVGMDQKFYACLEDDVCDATIFVLKRENEY